MNDVKKTVGIMGGMGPLATADLIYNIVSSTAAEKDSDHVHLIIDSDGSVPDRTAAILCGAESPLPHLCTMAKKLEYMGADIIAISCNTSHYYFSQICDAVNVPVIASGGAGCIDHFSTLFKTLPGVDAGLAASVFHFGEIDIPELKRKMAEAGIPARLNH